jgi:hypothetical protein
MSRALVTIRTDADRRRIWEWVCKAPIGTRVEFKGPKRSLPQNERLWAMLTDVATQVKWDGAWRTANDWKDLFMDALPREVRTVSALDGVGIVALGRSSSNLSKEEMSDLFILIERFGANHGVKFNDPAMAAA